MKVTYRLSKKQRIITERIIVYEVMARLHTGGIDQYAKTNIFVPRFFIDKNGNKKITWENGIVIPKISYTDEQAIKLKQMLTEAKQRLVEIDMMVGKAYDQLLMEKRTPPKGWLDSIINGRVLVADTLCDIYQRYVADERLRVSDETRKQYTSMVNQLRRYEAAKGVTLTLDGLTIDTLHDFNKFLIQDLGNSSNTASRRMKRLRSFIRWANGLSRKWPIEPMTHNNPFDRYAIGSEQYGTPFYLTIDERNKLEAFDFEPRLSRQRDIFVFQCLIGCRISDLWAMTKENIIDGAIEYIPHKTKEGRPITVRVPLNSHALAIVGRYKDNGDTRLFPFVSQQQYNEDIKEMLKLAGITRIVTILDPTTRQVVRRPINEVASSHMARRTFIGNLYKQVKDPNLVGKLSGHKEGSKAFARYRDIDEDMAKELVALLE